MLKSLTFVSSDDGSGFCQMPHGGRLGWRVQKNGTRIYANEEGGIVWDPGEATAAEVMFALGIENALVLAKAAKEYNESFAALIDRVRAVDGAATAADAARDTLPSECPTGPRC